ncbi:MAG: DUF378 domain-containing protein [Candidatus Pacebacteria bacterium]|nr:DUF378 domain-containing protein [Candidatus Paceibacterota bacterium]
MKALHVLAFVLVVVGALNWGLVAFGYNLVEMILGAGSTLTKVVYVLVALSAVYLAVNYKKDCKCSTGVIS